MSVSELFIEISLEWIQTFCQRHGTILRQTAMSMC